jgi:WD40 repeat protein
MLLLVALAALSVGALSASWRSAQRRDPTWVAFSPSGERLAAVFSNGTVQLWDVSGLVPRQVPTSSVKAESSWMIDTKPLSFLDDQTLVTVTSATIMNPPELVLWDIESNTRKSSIKLGSWPESMDFSSDGKHFATTDWTGPSVTVWNLETGNKSVVELSRFVGVDSGFLGSL